jgi:hypothetical protein
MRAPRALSDIMRSMDWIPLNVPPVSKMELLGLQMFFDHNILHGCPLPNLAPATYSGLECSCLWKSRMQNGQNDRDGKKNLMV